MAHDPESANWFKSLLISVYLLELVGASAITALGCVACRILQIAWIPSAPLWFAGYLLVYNLDHLYSDPADSLNTPLRFRWSARLRPYRSLLVWLSGAILLFWPLATGRFWLLVPLAAALSVFHFYSRPIPSTDFRLKRSSLPEVPYCAGRHCRRFGSLARVRNRKSTSSRRNGWFFSGSSWS